MILRAWPAHTALGTRKIHVSVALTFTKQDVTFASAELNRASFALPDLLSYTRRGTDTVLGLEANETRGSRLEIRNRTPRSNRVAWLHGLRPHVSAGVTCGYFDRIMRVCRSGLFFYASSQIPPLVSCAVERTGTARKAHESVAKQTVEILTLRPTMCYGIAPNRS